MNKFIFYVFILPISRLPYFLLYGISNCIYFILYYIVGYRKKVITNNIHKSFPSKSEKEKKKLVKQFYLHFCDLIMEAIKNFTVSEKQIEKRVKITNIEVLDKYCEQRKSVITIGGHYGNWEMFALAIANKSKHNQYAIYKPLSNDFFDKKMKNSRGVYGLKMVPMKKAKEIFKQKLSSPIALIFGSDQWPSNPERAIWTTFLGRETPFLFGAEKYAKEFDWPVIYCEILREKRGHYIVNYHTITDEPKVLEHGEIINRFVKKLEKTIEREPAYWLWSHKRWKKTKEEVFNTNNNE